MYLILLLLQMQEGNVLCKKAHASCIIASCEAAEDTDLTFALWEEVQICQLHAGIAACTTAPGRGGQYSCWYCWGYEAKIRLLRARLTSYF